MFDSKLPIFIFVENDLTDYVSICFKSECNILNACTDKSSVMYSSSLRSFYEGWFLDLTNQQFIIVLIFANLKIISVNTCIILIFYYTHRSFCCLQLWMFVTINTFVLLFSILHYCLPGQANVKDHFANTDWLGPYENIIKSSQMTEMIREFVFQYYKPRSFDR